MATIYDIDLVALIGADVPLAQTARTKGGELHGPCPFCGGRDRFYVHLAAGHGERALWRCRQCEQGGDAVDYVQQREGLTKGDALRELGIGRPAGPGRFSPARPPAEPEPPAPIEPPPAGWQATAGELVAEAEARLWSAEGGKALAWLRGRGLVDATIRAARFGYQAADEVFDLDGVRAFAPRGIVIPWHGEGQLWRVNFRRPVGPDMWQARGRADDIPADLPPAERLALGAIRQLRDATAAQVARHTGQRAAVVDTAFAALDAAHLIEPSQRYIPLPGSPNCVYGIDDVRPGRPLAVVEGELNVWAIRQEAGDQLGVVGLGAATHGRRIRWLARIGLARPVLIGLDDDDAGEKAAQYWLGALGDIARRWRPEAKDPNAMLMAGLDVAAWAAAGIAAGSDRASAPAPVVPVAPAPPVAAPIVSAAPAPVVSPAPMVPAPVAAPDLGGDDEIDFTVATPVRLAPGMPGLVTADLRVPYGIAVAKLASAPKPYVYVGRRMSDALPGSPLGNPFKAGEADDPIGQFRRWLAESMRAHAAGTASYSQGAAVAELRRLLGIYRDTGRLVLACWCAPEPCHADVIAAAVVYLADQEPLRVAEGWAMWDRETAAEGLPWVTVCERTGTTLRASRTVRQATNRFHDEIFPNAIQERMV